MDVTKRPPLFSRQTLCAFTFIVCLAALMMTWVIPAGPVHGFPATVLFLTLVVVLPVGELVRQRFRVSLRTMLLVVTVAGVLIAMFGNRSNRAREQRLAVAKLKNIHSPLDADRPPRVDIQYVTSRQNSRFLVTPDGWVVPGWVASALGKDFFVRTKAVSFSFQDLTVGRPLAEIDLNHFRLLTVHHCRVDGDVIRRISHVPNLSDLELVQSGLRDSDLAHFDQMKHLRRLRLGNHNPDLTGTSGSRNQFTAEGLEKLSGLTSLMELNLSSTDITGEDLASLRGLTGLRVLELWGTRVDNDQLGFLKNFPQLEVIDVSGTFVDERSMETFRRHEGLKWVTLRTSSSEVYETLQKQAAEEALEPDQRPVFIFTR